LYYFPSKEDKGPLFILRNKNNETAAFTHACPRLQIRAARRLDDHLLTETPSNPCQSRWGPPTCKPWFCSQPLEYPQGASCLCRDSGAPYSPLAAAGAVSSVQLPQRIPGAWTYPFYRSRDDGPGYEMK